MKPHTRIATLAAIAGASVLGASSPALASDFALTLSGPATTTVGHATVFHVAGTNPPPSAYPFPSWLGVAVSGAVSRCTYRWLVGGRVKANASANRLRLTRALHGRVLQCAVTATSPTGQSATATSAGVRA
jgi:hypothetical protein